MKISNKSFGEERALYNLCNAAVENCSFEGEEDGESALKECRDFSVENCDFRLRYPLWHGKNFTVANSRMYDTCRAALWYDEKALLKNCELHGIKAVRECSDVTLNDCDVISPEFGWKCNGVTVNGGKFTSEYFMLMSSGITLDGVDFKGKYSFQYTRNVVIENCVLDTKDAFWHASNVTVKNSVVKGEYLAWYSDNLTFVNCKISGTQPLCYCKNLKLVNCTMTDCDLSFEYSDVDADINGKIDSVKNPRSGKITADEIGEIITEDSIMSSDCVIKKRK
ncbi:MAG: DUF3737 family protein [Corallococcus sp.]|nr:DUF3737 family protein [Bacillota bacterium]MCM1534206.1 DUF3737 family protein [Corallococcus sp.]